MTITPNERELLIAIRDSDFHNGCEMEERVGNPVWSDHIEDDIPGKALAGKAVGGVMASLVRKGLVTCSDSGRDACVALTRAGLDAVGHGL